MRSPLSPYLGALELQFSLGSFYTFVNLSLMVLHQLESLHLDDYNLMYSQNKNRDFTKILTAFPLKTQHSPFYNHSSKPTWNLPKTTPPHLYWWFITSYNQTLGKIPRIHTKVHQCIPKSKIHKIPWKIYLKFFSFLFFSLFFFQPWSPKCETKK